MRIEYDVRPVTYMKTKAAELLRSVGESRRPVVITQSGEPRGVLMDYASYQELRQATLLLRLVARSKRARSPSPPWAIVGGSSRSWVACKSSSIASSSFRRIA